MVKTEAPALKLDWREVGWGRFLNYTAKVRTEHMPNQIGKAYSSPLDKLLNIGDPRETKPPPDYLAMGFEPEHIPELIRMATDEKLNNAPGDSAEVWAPLHAWRTLGKLRAEAAVEPLLGLFERVDKHEDDWVMDDLPEVFGEIGPAALPALSAYLADRSHGFGASQAAAESITKIAQSYPESRDNCVAALSRQLSKFTANGKALNGSLVAVLVDLGAVEAAPVMERAFAAGRVDQTVAGDWEDVQIDLGLKAERKTSGKSPIFASFRELLGPGLQRSIGKSSLIADLQTIQKAQKKARSQAKKDKWKSLMQRQKRR
jgi:hypothetical protein